MKHAEVGSQPPQQRMGLGQARRQFGRRGDVDVHRRHRQRDRENGGGTPSRVAETDRHQIGERNPRAALSAEADGRQGEPAVEQRHDAEGERHRTRELGRRPLELPGELGD